MVERDLEKNIPKISIGGVMAGGWIGSAAGTVVVNEGRIPLADKKSDQLKVVPVPDKFQPNQAEAGGIIAGTALIGAVVMASVVYGIRRFTNRPRA